MQCIFGLLFVQSVRTSCRIARRRRQIVIMSRRVNCRGTTSLSAWLCLKIINLSTVQSCHLHFDMRRSSIKWSKTETNSDGAVWLLSFSLYHNLLWLWFFVIFNLFFYICQSLCPLYSDTYIFFFYLEQT